MLSENEIIQGLKTLGLKQGDICLLHSSLASLGTVEGGAETVVNAFLKLLGPEGTFAVPVFGALGIIPEIVKKRPDAVFSTAPVGTIAAIGPAAEKLCRDHWSAETAHGEGTPWAHLAEMGGYICLIGVDQDRNTFLHGVEARLKLPYLQDIRCEFDDPDGKRISKVFHSYPGPHREFMTLDPVFLERGAMTKTRIGNSEVRLMDAAKVMAVSLEIGRNDPAFVLCDNPACPDCTRQRAAIARTFFARESFRLTASSRLAGRYVPEMIENCRAAGIGDLELDVVQGRQAMTFTPERLAAVVQELKDGGIGVSALSAGAAPAVPEKLINAMKKAGIRRLILPLNASAPAAELALKEGIAVDFRNTSHTMTSANAAFARRKEKLGEGIGICFNPASFAAYAGEMPFTTYRNGRFIRTMRQFDLADALFDGTPVPFAHGNAEVKEILSILRCNHFDGWISLCGGSPTPCSLAEAAKQLHDMIIAM